MNIVFLILWLLFFNYLVLLEFFIDPLQENMTLWGLAFGYFVLLESVGVIRSRRGDTLSETVWLFNDEKIGRAVFAGAIGLYLALRLYSVGGFPGLPDWLPRAVLVSGLGFWLVVHFVTRGKKG